MKILIRRIDNLVIYAQDDLVLSEERLEGFGWIDNNFNLSNSQIVEVVILPEFWTGAVWKYENNEFIVSDTQRYIEIIQDAYKATVPPSITDLQARLVLAQLGKIEEVEAMALTDPIFYIWFDRALTWERNNAYVLSAAAALSLTETQLDELFILGATL